MVEPSVRPLRELNPRSTSDAQRWIDRPSATPAASSTPAPNTSPPPIPVPYLATFYDNVRITQGPDVLITADRSPHVRAAAREEKIAVLNKPVKQESLRALLGQWRTQQLVAAE